VAIGLSGNYDAAAWHGWGERGDATYFNNPVDYVPSSAAITWTGCAAAYRSNWWSAGRLGDASDRRAALDPASGRAAAGQGHPLRAGLWGHDVAHDWPWWQRQIAHHLPRFC